MALLLHVYWRSGAPATVETDSYAEAAKLVHYTESTLRNRIAGKRSVSRTLSNPDTGNEDLVTVEIVQGGTRGPRSNTDSLVLRNAAGEEQHYKSLTDLASALETNHLYLRGYLAVRDILEAHELTIIR